jgi:pimeloyl-ACP methyl ester carboxylesterase
MPPSYPNLHLQPVDYRATDGRSVPAERGTLSVPARRDAAGGARFDLAFVRLPAVPSARSGVPVVFLTGGPGLSAIRAGRGRLFGWFDALRIVGDVILLDQRGSGESAPALRCGSPGRVPLDRFVTREDQLAGAVESMRRCVAELAHCGIDIGGLNTVESADDVADLVRALDYPRANLLGWSYGTHLAMSVIKRHESVVARAVFAGPEGPDHTYKLPARVHRQFDTIDEMVRRDPGLRGRVPQTRDALERVLRRVEREPARVRLPADVGDARDAVIGRFDLEWMMAEALADTRFLRRMPAVLARMAHGDFGDVAEDRVLRGAFEGLRTALTNSPLRTCMDCASGATPQRWERIQREAREFPLGRTIDWPLPEIGDALGNPDLGDAFRAAPRSDVPVLFVTGMLDCRTPLENALDLMPGFVNAQSVIAEDAGHGDLLLPPGVQRAIQNFLRDGAAKTERVRADKPFVFERPPSA